MALLTRLQEGHWTGAAWTEAGDPVANERTGKVTGLIFSGATLGESRLLAATLNLVAVPSSLQLPVYLSVYARAGVVAPLWSSGNPPPALATLSALAAMPVALTTLTAAGAQAVPLTLDLPNLDAARTIGYSPDTPWDGRFALHIHAETQNATDLTLAAAQAAFDLELTTRVFTGIEIGGPLSKRAYSRPDICPVCGEESLRETWAYCPLHNRLECVHCIDPDDIPRRFGPSRNVLVNDEG